MRKFNYFLTIISRYETKKIEQFKIRYFIFFFFCKMKLFEKKFVTFLYKKSNEQYYGSIIGIDLSLFIVNCCSSKECKKKWKIFFFI